MFSINHPPLSEFYGIDHFQRYYYCAWCNEWVLHIDLGKHLQSEKHLEESVLWIKEGNKLNTDTIELKIKELVDLQKKEGLNDYQRGYLNALLWVIHN